MSSFRRTLIRLGCWPPWLYALWALASAALSGALEGEHRWALSALVAALAAGWAGMWWWSLRARGRRP